MYYVGSMAFDPNYLAHHGIKGQKWGVRRFQNPDGTLTDEGKRHYSSTVFVSGSSKTQDRKSGYYRKKLPESVRTEIDEHIKNGGKILVGDAPGIDRQVQKYLRKKHYGNVEVFGPGEQVRYLADKKWKTNAVNDLDHEPMSKEWLAKKDELMTDLADHGLAVVLDEGSKATRKNVERLISQNKDVSVYELNKTTKDWDREISNPPSKKEIAGLKRKYESLQKKLDSLNPKAVKAWHNDDYSQFSGKYMWKVESAVTDIMNFGYELDEKYGKEVGRKLFKEIAGRELS